MFSINKLALLSLPDFEIVGITDGKNVKFCTKQVGFAYR